MTRSSRIPRFFRQTVHERRGAIAEYIGCDPAKISRALDGSGLDAVAADRVVENVIGTYALPFGIATNMRVNDRDYLVPMVVEEPSVIAAVCNAARIVRDGGGFHAEADRSEIAAQIQLWDVFDRGEAARKIHADQADLLAMANGVVPGLVSRGGGARRLEVRDLGDGLMVVHVIIDVLDAMGANLANTVAEALAPAIRERTQGVPGLAILSNLTDQRLVRVRAKIATATLAMQPFTGEEVRDRIVRASRFAERDPYRAATHNKGIMNGIDAVAVATGNDWRAVEAGAHAYAAREGRYAPLATWECAADASLVGSLELPLALGTVGGALRAHAGAQLAREILGVGDARELAMVAASTGLASNLAALRALATEGIQRGHMSLHGRAGAP